MSREASIMRPAGGQRKSRDNSVASRLNILLYSLNRDCPEHGPARAFVEACAGRSDIAITELVLVELYGLLRNPAVVRKPLEAADAASLCQAFRRYPRWHSSRRQR